MKIIDTNVYYGRWPFRKCGEEDFSRIRCRCNNNGVDGMLVSSVNAIFYEDPFEAEVQLHHVIKDEKNVHHVMSVNPLASGWEDDIRIASEEFQVCALKVFPGYHGYSLQGPEIARVCEAAGKYNLPLILATCVEDVRVTYMLRQTPIPLDKLGVFLGTYRDNTIVLSNISFGETMGLRPNILSRDKVYVDMAGFKFISFPIEKLLKVYPKEMFLFGSQCPLYVQKGILNEVIREKLPDDVKQAILCDNATRVFRLGEA